MSLIIKIINKLANSISGLIVYHYAKYFVFNRQTISPEIEFASLLIILIFMEEKNVKMKDSSALSNKMRSLLCKILCI